MADHKESKRTLAMHIPSFSPTSYDTSFKLFTSYIHSVYHYTKHGSCVTESMHMMLVVLRTIRETHYRRPQYRYCTEEIQYVWGQCVVTEKNAVSRSCSLHVQLWDTQMHISDNYPHMHISDNYPHKSLTKYYCLYAQNCICISLNCSRFTRMTVLYEQKSYHALIGTKYQEWMNKYTI